MTSRRPGMTKTQALRTAKSTALIKQYEEKQTTLRPATTDLPKRPKKQLTIEPKKVDFTKPGMTKAMMARMKKAEKFKEEFERKKQEEMAQMMDRRPRRTAAPVGGDARMGREKISRRDATMTCPPSARTVSPARSTARSVCPSRKGTRSMRKDTIPDKTCELARTMDADIVEAEPVGGGPIDNIVIPPGTIKDDRTTIITIPKASADASHLANRSIQVISETLEEQEEAESVAMHNKLADLQQARRDFVMAVANVGGNAVNIADEGVATIAPYPPKSPPRYIRKCPDIDDPYLKIEYGRDHPIVEAARQFLKDREEARRREEEFQRAVREVPYDFNLDVPFEEELYLDRDISWEEDEMGQLMPVPSRAKIYSSPIPEKTDPYHYSQFNPEELERFFDVERYPSSPPRGPPPGREHLHPDLWEIEDIWYKPPPPPDDSDLIEFSF